MDLSIVIVNFNTKRLTLDCLESVFHYLDKKLSFEVIVVDNASHDGSPDAFREFSRLRPNVRVIESETNLGFAKANNVGIRAATGVQVLLLNSDAYLIDDSIISAIRYLESQSDVFGCGCTLLKADKTPAISYGRFPDFFVVFWEIATGRFTKLRGVTPSRIDVVHDIDLPCGAFFLIKKEMFERVGLFDEGFFMYCEESDLAKRAWKAGYRVVFFGPAHVVHLGAQSQATASWGVSEKINTLKKVFYQSWSYYLEKHHSRLQSIGVKAIILAYFRILQAIFFLKRNNKASAMHALECKALQSGWGEKS
jgi:GT2 family glycosyltransferase